MPVYKNGSKVESLYHNGNKIKKAFHFGNLVYQIQDAVKNYTVTDTGISFGPGFFRDVVVVDYGPSGTTKQIVSEPFDTEVNVNRFDTSSGDYTSGLVKETYNEGQQVTVTTSGSGGTTTVLTTGGSFVSTKQIWTNSEMALYRGSQTMSFTFTTSNDAYFNFSFNFAYQDSDFQHTGKISINQGSDVLWESSEADNTTSRYASANSILLNTGTSYTIKWPYQTLGSFPNYLSGGRWYINAGCRFAPSYTYYYNTPMNLYVQSTRNNFLNEEGEVEFVDEYNEVGLYPEGQQPSYFETEPVGVFYIDEEGLITQYEMFA